MRGADCLIVPIETKFREIDAKIYMSCVAAEAGFSIVVGDQNEILSSLARLPRGLYLDKSIARTRVRQFQRLDKLGFRIAAWCEEGLVYRNRDAYLNERVAPAAFERVDAFFAWGRKQADDIRGVLPDPARRIIETGNPRFDLLRPSLREYYRPEAEALRRQHGQFILINTNFARFNHFYGRDRILEILRERGSIRDAADEAFFRGWIDFLGSVFHSFEDMLPCLSRAFPELTIVVRPHPSENHERWKEIARDLPNVRVIYEGNVVPWLLAAEVSIHNSCTTGLEAALLDRPVIAYRTVRSSTYDSYLPNRVSVEAATFDDLAARVGAALAGDHVPPAISDPGVVSDLNSSIASLAGADAAGRIVEHLRSLASIDDCRRSRFTGRAVQEWCEQFGRRVARTALAPLRPTQGYAQQKFPGLSHGEVEARIARFREVTGRFGNVVVKPSGGALFRIFESTRGC